MGSQIVKQPGGGYAVWSTVADDFTTVDAEPGEIIEKFVDEHRRRVTDKVNSVVAALERGDRPYFQFTESFEDCMKIIREVHGRGEETLNHFGRDI